MTTAMNELFQQQIWAIDGDALASVCAELGAAEASGSLFRAPEPAPRYETRQGVAIINAVGTLSKRGGWWSRGYEAIQQDIAQALDDPKVNSILLNVDSPGGGVDGVKVLADWIRSAREKKPLCAYADGNALSAAYWIAAATGRIYAPQTARLGSIGIVMQHVDWSKSIERKGANVTYIHSGKYKVVGNSENPLSANDLAYLQAGCDATYQLFTQDVAESMNLDASSAESWADGKIFLAGDALEKGLLTGITAGRDELIELLAKETPMNRAELEKKYPDAFAEVTREAEATLAASTEKLREELMHSAAGLVKAVAGDAVAAQFSALAKAGITDAQLEALRPLLTQPESQPKAEQAQVDASSRQQILTAITDNSAKPLAHAEPQKDEAQLKAEAMQESIARMSALPRS